MKEFDPNCIFCKIADGVVSSFKIYEDDEVMAFLDANPLTKGHALVISKRHFDNFLATPKHIMNQVMNVAQRIGQLDVQVLGAKGVNIITNCYESAGQVIRHFHVHVIPRYDATDGFKIENNPIKDANLPAIYNKLKDQL